MNNTSPGTAGEGKSEQPDASEIPEAVPLEVTLPPFFEGEIRYCNHLAATFTGRDFLLTLAQIPIPLIATKADFEAAAERVIVPRLVEQFAVPTDRFLDALERFSELVARLRSAGILPEANENES